MLKILYFEIRIEFACFGNMCNALSLNGLKLVP
jgi:hypothetical protein